MSGQVLGINPLLTGDSLEDVGGHALGTTAWDHKGRAFTLVQAKGAIVVNAAVLIESGFDCAELDSTNAAASVAGGGQGAGVGVAMAALSDNQYGWVCRFGQGDDVKVLAAANCESGARLYATSTDGTLDDGGTIEVAGISTLADITTAAAVKAQLNWPYVAGADAT